VFVTNKNPNTLIDLDITLREGIKKVFCNLVFPFSQMAKHAHFVAHAHLFKKLVLSGIVGLITRGHQE